MRAEIKPMHIQLKKGDISERVLIAGDPERIKEVASLLDEPKLLWSYRYLVYKGNYKGKEITLSSHGIGAPSIAIAVEELHALGGDLFIRLGTCGGLITGQKYGDIIIPDSAAFNGGGTIGEYIGDTHDLSARPDPILTEKLIKNVKTLGRTYFIGPIFSSEAFYSEMDQMEAFKKLNLIGVEMECATLFTLGRLRGFKSAAILIVVDNLKEKTFMLPAEKIHEYSRTTAIAALDALAES